MKISKEEQSKQEKLNQARLISGLATRLPWIVLAITLIAFVLIFLQALLQ
jgi:ABC-type multidrug transport system permease subunit